MNATDLILSFSTPGPYVVTRRVAATYPRGISTPGVTSTLSIIASVQPATGRDLQRLPEARRSTETRVLYTTTQLYVGAEGAPYEADLIAIDGQTWEAQHTERWYQGKSQQGEQSWRVIVQAQVGQSGQVAV